MSSAAQAMRRTGAFPLRTWRRDGGALLALALLAALLAMLAYRVPFQTVLDIGGGPGGVYDRPYLNLATGWNTEPETTPEGQAYRWAFTDARLRWPGIGAAPIALTVVALGRGDAAVGRWFVNDVPLTNLTLRPEARQYQVLVPTSGETPALRLTAPPVANSNDPRDLALAVDRIGISQLRAPTAPNEVLWFVASAMLAYALGRTWGMTLVPAFLAVALLILGGAALLAWQRPVLTLALPRWAMLLTAALPLTWLIQRGLAALARRLDVHLAVRSIAALVVLAWLIRAGALLHPQAYDSDRGLHTNNLLGVLRGDLVFTEDLTAEAGGGPAPYPPAGYVVLAPWAVFAPPAALTVLGATLVDALVIAVLALLCAGGGNAAAAPWAGALYLFALPSLRALSIGEMANVWGQALVLPAVVALLWWRRGAVRGVALGAWSLLALLGHFGVLLSTLAFWSLAVSGWQLGSSFSAKPRDGEPLEGATGPATWWRLAALWVVAAAAALAVYYSALWRVIVERPSAPQTATNGIARMATALGTLDNWRDGIGPLLLALGVAGLVVVWREHRSLRWLMLAWWGAALASLGTLLISQQALRWQLWLMPGIAVCGGVALAWLWQRGRRGQGLAVLVLGGCLARGAWLWVAWLAAYQHR